MLVEEASIGVESGADEYMFGDVTAVAADGRRIIVADGQADAVRTYDYAGRFLQEIGSHGQGPGEFTGIWAVAGDSAGNVYILDVRRVVVYDSNGTHARTFSVPSAASGWPFYVKAEGTLWLPIAERDRETRQRRYAAQAYNGEGPQGEPLYVPEIEFQPMTFTSGGRQVAVPLGPSTQWGPTPTGGVFVGAGDRYRFEVHHPDGSALVVEKPWEPIPYPGEEIEWWRRFRVMNMQSSAPGWDWDGAEIPADKPAFAKIIPDVSGGYWVVRPGPSVKLPDCTEDPLMLDSEAVGRLGLLTFRQCWDTEWLLDAFDEEGRFLGPVDGLKLQSRFGISGIYPRANLLFIDGDTIVAAQEGEDGVVRVKRYRLEMPG